MADVVVPEGSSERRLVPTPREVELGAVADDGWTPPAASENVERESVGSSVSRWLRELDPRGIPGPTTPLIVIALMAFVGRWGARALEVVLPEIRNEFALNLTFLLTLGSLVEIASTALAVPMGYLADRVKRVRMVQASALITSGSIIAQGLAPSVTPMVGATFVGGLGASVAEPASFPLLADYYPPSWRARAVGFFGVMGGLAAVLAPTISGRIAEATTWRTVFVGVGVASLAVALLTLLLREPPRGYWERKLMGASDDVAAAEQRPVSLAEGYRAAWSIVTLRRLCYATPFLTVGLTGIGLLVVVIYYSQVHGLTPSERGDVVTIGAAAAVVGLILAAPVQERLLRHSPGRLMTALGVSILVSAAGLIVMAFAPNLTLGVIGFLPVAVMGAMQIPFTVTVLSLVVPPRVRGLGIQTLAPARLVGLVVLPLLGPWLDGVDIRRGLLVFVPILVIGAMFIMSAAPGVARDIRAATAASMADEEAKRAKAAGRGKMVICRDVDVEYAGVQVLFGVDFDVEEGEIIALLGTNGAGKSTLLRAIAGVQQASGGAIFLDGHDVTHAPPYQLVGDGVVMMPGGAAVFPALTVRENLRTARWLQREDDEPFETALGSVLALFPSLEPRLDEIAGNLSGGEQQMVGLSQALLMRPRLLMIDELSLGLAPAIVEQLLDVLRTIHARGTTIILVEQSLNVALTIAERAVFMEKGQIRFSGPTEELLARSDLVRAVFMGGATTGGGARRRRASVAPEADVADALTVDRISVSFGGVHALRDASLRLGAGEIVGIIGPNGAGKTTLFDVISGLVQPDAGSVSLHGVDATLLPPDARARMGLGRSFQNARLFPSLTVRETLAVALERRSARNPVLGAVWAPQVRRSEARLRRRADGLIDLLGLGAFADKFVAELSTGSRRAVDMACVMAAEPKVLLMDEPSSGLAQAETEQLGPVLVRIVRETGCGMLVIEHDLPLITSISDRLVAMELGATIAEGEPDQVVNDPRVLSSYLAASEDVINRSGTRMSAIASALDVDGATQNP